MKHLLLLSFLLCSLTIQAQNAGIGTTTPDPSAQLDISSTTRGLLIPRMTMAQRNAIASPATGLLIFQTDDVVGFYFYTGSSWTHLTPISNNSWLLTGNAGTDPLVNFVGTTDNKPLLFKINNIRSGFLGYGNVFWGKGSGVNNINGYSNVAIGTDALNANNNFSNLVAIGDSAMCHNGIGAVTPIDGLFNTAIGSKALYTNTTGSFNNATGYQALFSNTTGVFNTAFGSQALFTNTTGSSNTAIGSLALLDNTTGENNNASGLNSLRNNTTGNNNSAFGYYSLLSNTTGNSNVAIGIRALNSNTTNSNLVAIGDSAMFNNGIGAHGPLAGNYNTAVGSKALYSNTLAWANTCVGFETLKLSTTGYNTAVGAFSLTANTSGYSNTAIGANTLSQNVTGSQNCAFGESSLQFNNSGYHNTAMGYISLRNNSTGQENCAFGFMALYGNTTGNFNTGLGDLADVAQGNLTNATAIGYLAKVDASNKVRIGNTNVTVIEGQVAYSFPSDARFKYNIRDNVPGLDFINKLKPVTYYFDTDKLAYYTKTGTIPNPSIYPVAFKGDEQLHTGFLAQDVEKIANELGYQFDGIHHPANDRDHYSLAYSQFIMPLVKAVQEQQAMINQLRKQAAQSEVQATIKNQQAMIKALQETINENKEQSAEQMKLILALQEELNQLKKSIK